MKFNLAYLISGIIIICVLFCFLLLFFITNNNEIGKNDDPKSILILRQKFIQKFTRELWNDHFGKILDKGFFTTLYEDTTWFILDEFSLVKSLSTLLVMNLTDEYRRGFDWMQKNPFNFSSFEKFHYITADRIATEYIGSMLSCYALTGNVWFVNQAMDAGNHLKMLRKNSGKSNFKLQ